MKQINFLIVLLLTTTLFSCASLRKKGSTSMDDSTSPYVNEEAPKPKPNVKSENIIVREEKVKAIESETDKTNYRFYVIIGSFRIIENAKNYKTQLTEKGFVPTILENENGLFRIAVKSTNNEQQARNEIANIRDKHTDHDDVWLLISSN